MLKYDTYVRLGGRNNMHPLSWGRGAPTEKILHMRCRKNVLSSVFKVSATQFGSFPLVPPPSLVGAYYLPPPPDARAIFLHNDLFCNDTCSVTGGGGRITYWGAQTEKIPQFNEIFCFS